MEKIVVTDTNVFVSLLNVGLLDVFFQLPWEIHTTDFLMSDLLREGLKDNVAQFVKGNLLHVATFDFDELLKINNLYNRTGIDKKLSLSDCSVLFYAKQNNFALLACDNRFLNPSKKENVEVRSIMYVLDRLVESELISSESALNSFRLLKEYNLMIPQLEIEKYLKLWNEKHNKKGG